MLTQKANQYSKKAVDSEETNDESQSFALQSWKMLTMSGKWPAFFGFTLWSHGDS